MAIFQENRWEELSKLKAVKFLLPIPKICDCFYGPRKKEVQIAEVPSSKKEFRVVTATDSVLH